MIFYRKKFTDVFDNVDAEKNNFDFLRFVAALLVIISHSFPISYGSQCEDPLRNLTETLSFGLLGVYIFFIISGFLITYSYERSKNITIYFTNRFLRIYPALIFQVCLTVLILGPFISNFSFIDYFFNQQTYEYMLTNTIFIVKYHLPGVFVNNPYQYAVNGSLWTLKYELICYVIVAFLGIIGLIKKIFVIISLTFCIIITLIMNLLGLNEAGIYYSFYYILHFFIFFGMGMLYYLFRDKMILDFRLFILSILMIIFSSFYPPLLPFAVAIAGPYSILYLAFLPISQLNNFSKYGDFSYGIYIYAFPVQQLVSKVLLNNQNWVLNILIAAPIIIIFSICSWHLVEKNALSLKKAYKN